MIQQQKKVLYVVQYKTVMVVKGVNDRLSIHPRQVFTRYYRQLEKLHPLSTNNSFCPRRRGAQFLCTLRKIPRRHVAAPAVVDEQDFIRARV